jgi:hypothetical protein
MSRLRFPLAALAVVLTAAGAHAQATRTWVSGVGDDANPCSRTAPCKTFAGAISKTAAGGEISTLDPGGFGGVTITKAITISGDGTLSGILAAGTNGVVINAAAADKVFLRNLSINGAGTGLNGIRYLAGGQVVVENLTIDGFTNHCIDVSLAAAGNLHVRDSRLAKCNSGIRLNSTAGNAAATLDNVRIFQTTNGVEVATNGRFAMRNSVITGNASNGVLLTASTSLANIFNSMLSFNVVNGLSVNASGAVARSSRTGYFNNSTAWAFAAGGVIQSDGDNVFGGNSSDGALPNGAALIEK